MDLDENGWNVIGYILASPNRRKVTMRLEKGFATPSQLAKDTGIRLGHVSIILRDLRVNNIALCRNPSAKRGRVYELTEIGLTAMKQIGRISK